MKPTLIWFRHTCILAPMKLLMYGWMLGLAFWLGRLIQPLNVTASFPSPQVPMIDWSTWNPSPKCLVVEGLHVNGLDVKDSVVLIRGNGITVDSFSAEGELIAPYGSSMVAIEPGSVVMGPHK